MESINQVQVMQRITTLYDTNAATQGDGKSIQKYVKTARKAVDLTEGPKGTSSDFAQDFGAGL